MNESIRLAGEDGACAAGTDVNSSANTGRDTQAHLRLNAVRRRRRTRVVVRAGADKFLLARAAAAAAAALPD